MAKITIAGDAVVITSSMKLEDLAKIKKYRPDALVLKGGEDGKEPIFCVSVSEGGSGSINKYGVEFTSETHDDAKLASVTMVGEGITGDIREVVADNFGLPVLNLNKIEATLPAVLAEIDAEKASIMANITVAQ